MICKFLTSIKKDIQTGQGSLEICIYAYVENGIDLYNISLELVELPTIGSVPDADTRKNTEVFNGLSNPVGTMILQNIRFIN